MPTKKRTDKIVWEAPPATVKRPRVDHVAKAETLKTRPGEWGIVATYDSSSIAASVAQGIRGGTTNAWKPRGAYEATARTVEKEHRVYARYVGGETSE